jgi:hypothetical protein
MIMARFVLIFSLVVIFISCKEDKEQCAFQPPIAKKVEINFQSLEDSLFTFKTKQQLVDFFSRHVALRDVFFNRQGYPSDSLFINRLYSVFHNQAFDSLRMETKRIFGNGEELRKEFELAFSNIRYYYPDFNIPKIQTVITGLESDLFVSDTLILVGLDYYLGQDAKYKPDMHKYMQRRYTKEFVVPSAMLLYGIDRTINEVDPQDKTVLADMIAYGKAYYFAKHMLPCVPDSVLMGYTAEEIAGARENQDVIWKHFIDKEVFFKTTKNIKQKYIDERPKTVEVGDQCPGRIGVWVGWQIVQKYSEQNSKISLPELMKLPSAQQIFSGSKYRPK